MLVKMLVIKKVEQDLEPLQSTYSMLVVIFFKKDGPTPASFIVYFRSFQTNIIAIFTTNVCEKMFIQYTELGYKPMTFVT